MPPDWIPSIRTLRARAVCWTTASRSTRRRVGGGTIALAVGRDTEVRLLDDGFRLRRIVRWSDPDRDVTGADVQAWRDDYIERRGGRNSPEWDERDDASIDPQIPVADNFPSMSGVRIGRDGRLWVLPYQRPRADRVRWMGFEPDGAFLCHLESAQTGLTTYEFGKDYWLGVNSDELGIRTAVMYPLHTPAPNDAPAGSGMP